MVKNHGPSVLACALDHHRPDKRSLSIPEDVDEIDVDALGVSKKEGCRSSDPGCLLPSQFTSVRLRSIYAGIFQTSHLLAP